LGNKDNGVTGNRLTDDLPDTDINIEIDGDALSVTVDPLHREQAVRADRFSGRTILE
jgi:hypothetical protein